MQAFYRVPRESVNVCVIFTLVLAWKLHRSREHISLVPGPQGVLCKYTQTKKLVRES